MSAFRVLATDYDGTLVAHDRPTPAVLAALAKARAGGLLLVLVTGRRLAPLLELLPDALDRFDAIVAENGAVLARREGVRTLAPAQPAELIQALEARGVPLERGQVILGSWARHAAAALEEIQRLGLDVQLLRNREALMLLPPGVTKGSGLRHALEELGASVHDTVAVGDAENDHALFEASELAVAVANAIPSLQRHADVVLSRPHGEGIIELLEGPLANGRLRVASSRHTLVLGADDTGACVRLPATPATWLVTGASGSGKSYVAGLIAERLLTLDYSLCVIDPEGDYENLARHHRTLHLGGPAPSLAELADVLERGLGSVILDLSRVEPHLHQQLARDALRHVASARADSGSPHWLVADEAHLLFGHSCACNLLAEGAAGLLLVTYRPETLCPDLVRSVDLTLDMAGDATRRRVRLESRMDTVRSLELTVDTRQRAHVRHRHKYAHATLPPALRFQLRARGELTGRSAANLRELVDELRRCDDAVIVHHVAGGDLSRWVKDVIRDDVLAGRLRDLEAEARARPATAERARLAIIAAVERRYLEPAAPG